MTMAFWGVEVKPGEPYVRDPSRGARLRVTQATLGDYDDVGWSILECRVGDMRPVRLCALNTTSITRNLDLEYEEEENIVLSVLGTSSIHLSGYYICSHNADNGHYSEKPTGKAISCTCLKRKYQGDGSLRNPIVCDDGDDNGDNHLPIPIALSKRTSKKRKCKAPIIELVLNDKNNGMDLVKEQRDSEIMDSSAVDIAPSQAQEKNAREVERKNDHADQIIRQIGSVIMIPDEGATNLQVVEKHGEEADNCEIAHAREDLTVGSADAEMSSYDASLRKPIASDDGDDDGNDHLPITIAFLKRRASEKKKCKGQKPMAPRKGTRMARVDKFSNSASEAQVEATSQKKNSQKRCNAQTKSSGKKIVEAIRMLSPPQKDKIMELGFGKLLEFKLTFQSTYLIDFLMNNTNAQNLVICVGGGDKVLRIDQNAVHCVLGVPTGTGKDLPHYADKNSELDKLKLELGLTKTEMITLPILFKRIETGNTDDLTIRCFFLVLFSKLLFPSSQGFITGRDAAMTRSTEELKAVNWAKVVVDDLRSAVKKWHKLDSTKRRTICCCVTYMLLYYLDHLDYVHAIPCDKVPRAAFYDDFIVREIIKADGGTDHTYGKLNFRSMNDSCYLITTSDGAANKGIC